MAINTANELLSQLLALTGSSNAELMKTYISFGERKLRNLDLPLLVSNPYEETSVGIADSQGFVPIPKDMRNPIQFFKSGAQFTVTALCTATSGSNFVTLTVAPVQNLIPNMVVSGAGIAPGTVVLTYANQIATLSQNTTAAINGTLTFKSNPTILSTQGPWIVYNREGTRQGITRSLSPYLNVTAQSLLVNSGYFSEVGTKYQFSPPLSQGDFINMCYYKTIPTLFSNLDSLLLSASATISNAVLGGISWTATITVSVASSLDTVQVGDTVSATAGSGDFGATSVEVIAKSELTLKVRKPNIGVAIVNGSITNLSLNRTVQSNVILSVFPEGYMYAALARYYTFNNNVENQQKYEQLFLDSVKEIEEQNSKGMYSGGDLKLRSPYSPRGKIRVRSLR